MVSFWTLSVAEIGGAEGGGVGGHMNEQQQLQFNQQMQMKREEEQHMHQHHRQRQWNNIQQGQGQGQGQGQCEGHTDEQGQLQQELDLQRGQFEGQLQNQQGQFEGQMQQQQGQFEGQMEQQKGQFEGQLQEQQQEFQAHLQQQIGRMQHGKEVQQNQQPDSQHFPLGNEDTTNSNYQELTIQNRPPRKNTPASSSEIGTAKEAQMPNESTSAKEIERGSTELGRNTPSLYGATTTGRSGQPEEGKLVNANDQAAENEDEFFQPNIEIASRSGENEDEMTGINSSQGSPKRG